VTERERRFGRWKVCPDAADHDLPRVKCNTCGYPDPWPRPKWRKGELVTSNPFARAQSRDPEARRYGFLSTLADFHVHLILLEIARGIASAREIAERRRYLHRWMATHLEGTTWAKAKQIGTLMADAMKRAQKAGRTDARTARMVSFEVNTIHLYLETALPRSR